jgi:hypothetical protein
MLLAATAGRSPRLQRRFQRHAAPIVRRARRAGIKSAGSHLAPSGVPVCPPFAVTVPGIVEAMPPRFAAARRQRVSRLAVATLRMAARAEDARRVSGTSLCAAGGVLARHIGAVPVGLHIACGNRHQQLSTRRSLGHERGGRQQNYPAYLLHSVAPVEGGEQGAWSRESILPAPHSGAPWVARAGAWP